MRVSDDWLGPHRPATDSEKGRNGTSRHGVEEARRRLEGGFLDQNGTVPSMVARPPSPRFQSFEGGGSRHSCIRERNTRATTLDARVVLRSGGRSDEYLRFVSMGKLFLSILTLILSCRISTHVVWTFFRDLRDHRECCTFFCSRGFFVSLCEAF